MKNKAILLLLLALTISLIWVVPMSAGPIKDIDITPADDKAGAITDYEVEFTPKTSEVTAISIDFSAFGTTGTDMILSSVSTNISDYLFAGFSLNPTGVIVNDTTKIITFTGGTTTKDAEHTIINSTPGTGFLITNDQDAETKKVGFSTASDSGESWLTINPGVIDHYSVSNVISPRTAGTPIAVTIQAQDQFDNDISDGADAIENITISFGKTDTGATPTSTNTNNGKVTVGITMTVAQTGQSITFTGDTSGKTGTSNSFDVNPDALVSFITLTPPTADFSSRLKAGKAPLTIQFHDQSTGDINSWLWNFGDGGSSTQQNPSHIYTKRGFYTVILQVSGPVGNNVKIEEDYIRVYDSATKKVVEPARFSSSDLNVSPVQAYPDQPVTISLNILNTGGTPGWYNVTLNINGTVEQSVILFVNPSYAQPIIFTTAKSNPGIYHVYIAGMRDQFNVIETEMVTPPAPDGDVQATSSDLSIGDIIAITIIGVILTCGIVFAIRLTHRV